jgi:CheY-like chemotaxis protein
MIDLTSTSTLLIIEDDKAFVEDLLRLWTPEGRVLVAQSGAEALVYLQGAPPELILLDLDLPRALAELNSEEGFALLRHIRQELKWRVPVIVMTGRSRSQDRQRALELGASAFVRKPFHLASLQRELRRLGGLRGAESDPDTRA